MAEGILARKHTQCRNLIDNIDIGVYRYAAGPRGRFIEVNPAFVRLFGYDRKEEILSININRLFQSDDSKERIVRGLRRYGSIKEEAYLKRKDGSRFVALVTAHVMYDDRKRIRFYDGMVQDITVQRCAEDSMRSTLEKLYKTIEGTIRAMAQFVEQIDPYTAGHQRRVAFLAYQIAQELLLSEDRTRGIYIASLIHDIGKISVSPDILAKPGKLTDDEYEKIKGHSVFAYNILRTIEFPWPVPHIVLQHHERMDGSGYPYGLHARDIILEARILAVADVVEALGSDRPYRKAMDKKRITSFISQERGRGFDQTVVEVCLDIISQKNFMFTSDIMPILHCTVSA